MNTVHFVIITRWLFGYSYGASIFGVDFTAPARVEKTGVREISQEIKPQQQYYSNLPFEGINPLCNDNANNNKNEGLFYPGPVAIYDRIKPHQPSKFNKSTQATNQFSDSCVPIKDDQGSDSEKVPESIPQETNQNTDTGVSKSNLSETGIDDYTTETLKYETTTFEPIESINRMGGAPPAVVASLLG